jgi:hypothetical protein
MSMMVKDAKKVVEDQVAYYLGCEEPVEIPTVPDGGRDIAFLPMNGFCSV